MNSNKADTVVVKKRDSRLNINGRYDRIREIFNSLFLDFMQEGVADGKITQREGTSTTKIKQVKLPIT